MFDDNFLYNVADALWSILCIVEGILSYFL